MIFATLLTILYLTIGIHTDSHPDKYFRHTGASGTQHGREKNSSDYYKSNSGVPHLPYLYGFMGTHGTIRHMSIIEQTATVIGEAKHGLWRIHENGMVREYRKKGTVGLREGFNPNSEYLSQDTLNIINLNYASYLPDEGFEGYKYPDEKISDGSDGMKNHLNFIDLSIYHPKYDGKYNDHVPIDLPFFYCFMSQPDFPHVDTVWKYAAAQPMANRIGPLGKRAGLDIKENFPNVIRFNMFNDAGIWANIGVGTEETDIPIKNLQETITKEQTVNYNRLDLSKLEHEIYMYERSFLNQKYLVIAVVMDNKDECGPSELSYLRPDGAYWEDLRKRHDVTNFNTLPNHFPRVHIENESSIKKFYGLPVYGIHHPDRLAFNQVGGLCPNKGGDWGRYPWGNAGAGYPTNYEEITPLCDSLTFDVKIWANLWSETWNDKALLLGNTGTPGKITTEYRADANIYGKFEDPYLKNLQLKNPYIIDMTRDGETVHYNDVKPDPIKLLLNFTRIGTLTKFNNVLHDDKVEVNKNNNKKKIHRGK